VANSANRDRSAVTLVLAQWSHGDTTALDRLVPLIYPELRRIAGRQLRHERSDHTLQPTALVHELFLHLVDQRRATWDSRAHFFAVAAQLMRRILVDHARSRDTLKRGGAITKVALDIDAADVPVDLVAAEVLAVDEALARLATRDPDQARIVELRFFGGLSVEETAQVMNRSARTVKREWRMAKAWLFRELQGGKKGSVEPPTVR
jgi:RNA polymerase sigma factor (TIGR02999 family)